MRKPGRECGTRCEIKNVNSIRFAGEAIEYEARRQIDILEDGGSIDQETRLYDPKTGETRSMRSKEEAHDYRYFPCPDLLPLEIEKAWVDAIAAAMPELPDAKRARFVADYGMTEYDAGVLTAEAENAAFFEAVARGRDGKQAANWVINELFGRLNKEGLTVETSPVSATQLGGVLDLVASGEISGKMAKDLFELLWTTERGAEPAEVAAKHGMKQVTDLSAIEAAVEEIIAQNPAQVEKAKANPKLAGWFVGQVLKLEPREEPAEGLDARQLGNIYHHIFEQLYAKAADPADLEALLAALPAVAGAVLDAAPAVEGFRGAVQQAAVETLARIDAAEVPKALLAGWKSHTPAVRSAAISAALNPAAPNTASVSVRPAGRTSCAAHSRSLPASTGASWRNSPCSG